MAIIEATSQWTRQVTDAGASRVLGADHRPLAPPAVVEKSHAVLADRLFDRVGIEIAGSHPG